MSLNDIKELVIALMPTITAILTGICVIVKIIVTLKSSNMQMTTEMKEFVESVKGQYDTEKEEQAKIISAQQRQIEALQEMCKENAQQIRRVVDKVVD